MIRKPLFYLIIFSATAFFYVTCSEVTNPLTYRGTVIKVVDGDTISILHQGKQLRIRLAEIDAPERGQPYWRKSREALADYVSGKEVAVEGLDVDRYGRIVGHVYLGELWVNGELVEEIKNKAASMFCAAAKKGDSSTNWLHGLDLVYGGHGFELNIKKGIEYIYQAAQENFKGAIETLIRFYV